MTGAASPSPSDRPTQLGPFKVLDVIGEGGMGTVYLAEQREPVRRRAAVKVIKLGMDSKAVVARFEAERKALALMEHSSIAQVFDAGLTPTGQPWFAMEYVKGIPITDYCDRNKLSLEQRIDLFQKVCSGVQHAHLKGVMHRDLKPGNVLVTLQDGAPTPKIIDFGLAKATDHRLVEATIFTEHGTVVGTPEYMSPEQAGLDGLDVDTRTDVYSLGVLLYELLTGELPFSRKELHAAGYLEMQRVIREQEPTKPSTKVTTLGNRALSLAQMRAMTSGDFGKALRGDLDWITLRALEKDRTRRYATAQELAADLDRYRKLEPVLATPPSWGYRAKKFVRKYRVQCVAGVIVLGAIVAGGFGIWWKSVEADEQRRIAIQAATEAQRQQKLANESAEAAKASELRAKEQEQLATKRANEIESFAAKDRIYADIARLQDAESRAATLWPAHPSLIADFERWIADVEPILNRLPQIEKDLAEVRLRARSTTVEAIAAARAPIAAEIERLQRDADEAQPRERRAIQKDIAELEIQIEAAGYDFAERADAERHLQLAKLSQLSRSFSKNDKVVAMRGAMVSMRDRLAEAQALAAARPTHQQSWQQAITAIAASDGKTASTLYAHFVLTEQEGLVPIGMDPESKLWEFVHLPSGTKGKEIPRRDPSTGRLVPDGDMGIVFVLLPGGMSWVGTTDFDPDFANRRVASLRREISLASGAAQLEIPKLPSGVAGLNASDLNSYAWPRCAPEKVGDQQDRKTFGEEALALAAAHAAVQKATGTATESTYLDTLAWALVANGQDAEARQRSAEALAKAPVDERSIFEGYQRAIDAAIAQRVDRLRAAEAKAAEPKGTGCPNYDPERSNDETPHQVQLTPYFLSKYEMTQGQWLRLTGKNPSRTAGENNLALPVEQVSWFDCEEWMRLRSLSLPTEAQWEVGCRAGTTTPWWTGSDENELKAKENVGSNKLAAVGSKHPNPFGLCDTHGNLWEWCREQGWSDQSPREGDGFRSGGSPSNRSLRGNYFGGGPRDARAGRRNDDDASYRLVNLGLRPARASRL